MKVLAFLITAVYWFHPLVWAAYFSMIRDMEMSCDEQILWESGEDIRQNYSMSLLAFATNKRQYSMETLAFGETNTKKRVRHIMKCKKKGKWMSVCAVLLFAILGTACLTSGKDGETDAGDGPTVQADQNGQQTDTVGADDGQQSQADVAKAESAASLEEFLRQGIRETMPEQVAEQLKSVKCRTVEGDGSEITYLFGNGGKGGEDTLRLDFTYKDGLLNQYVSKEYGYLDALSESIGEVWHDPDHTEKDLESRSIDLIQEFEKAFLKVSTEDDSQYKKLKTPARYQGDETGESYRLFKNTASGDTYVVCLFYDMVIQYDAANGKFSPKNAAKIAYKDYVTPNNEWEYCNIQDSKERKIMTQWMDAALIQMDDPGYETLKASLKKNLKSQRECGFSLYYKGKYWTAYDGGYLVGEDGDILYSAKLTSFPGGILKKTVDFAPVKPKDFSGISEASLVYVPEEAPERDHESLKITDEKELAMLEQAFSHAEYVRGGSDCPMGEIRLWLYRSKIAKKELIVALAGDGCPIFRAGGVTYRYDDSKFSDSLKKKLHSYDVPDSTTSAQMDKTDK